MAASELTAGQAFDDYLARRHFTNLDGLRFVCIAMVIWHHAQPVKLDSLPALKRGFLGVDFFFVLSGYLITTLLLREAARDGSFSLKNFYIRRILRIVPVYFFVVAVVSTYFILIKGQAQMADLVPYYFLFLSNFLTDHIPMLGITWSLSVEEQYYLVWPLLLLVIPPRMILPIAFFVVALNVVISQGLLGLAPYKWGMLVFKLPNATYAPIIMGSIAAILLNRRPTFGWLYRLTGSRNAAVAGFILLCFEMQFLPQDIRGWPNLVLHLTMSFTLIALVVRDNTSISRFLTEPLIARIGLVSYGIYLYHLIALDIVSRLNPLSGQPEKWATLILYFAVSYLIAEVSFRTLEAYFRRFRPKGGQH
ncbi:O-acetyltransferase OatA [Roseovarius litorisediminis]|uniref:O-acetyltransferase OatA n=1 Tax=Roseovarius litorisediminis TaxID=1312363 RepID=A0A1Y5SSJ8_9RHOB|nr:acyltransferase [Roseovarius litorisediminis]SLN46789.1 O-acetyltransferase OatA [Roseovarius litorisediminis]